MLYQLDDRRVRAEGAYFVAETAQVIGSVLLRQNASVWFNAVLRGVDIFDCVLPTRLARHHSAFTPEGRLNLMNASHSRDPRPIDESCDCYACRTFSRAYIRHLITTKELLAGTLISIHNLRALIRLMEYSHYLRHPGLFCLMKLR